MAKVFEGSQDSIRGACPRDTKKHQYNDYAEWVSKQRNGNDQGKNLAYGRFNRVDNQ